MASSGQYRIRFTEKDVIDEALSFIGVRNRFGDLNAFEVADARRTLNGMLKQIEADRDYAFNTEDVVVFLQKGKAQYNLSPTGDHAALASDVVQTALSAAAPAGAMQIVVAGFEGIADGDTAIVTLANGYSFAATVQIAVNPDVQFLQDDDGDFLQFDDGSYIEAPFDGGSSVISNTYLDLSEPLPSDANAGAVVYLYTTRIQTPIDVAEASYRDVYGQDSPVWIYSRSEYLSMTDKSQIGDPTQLNYDRRKDHGLLRLWQAASDVTKTLRLSVSYPLQIFTDSNDEADLPQEWYEAMTCGLAVRLAPKYGIYGQQMADLRIDAERSKYRALNAMSETGSVRFYA